MRTATPTEKQMLRETIAHLRREVQTLQAELREAKRSREKPNQEGQQAMNHPRSDMDALLDAAAENSRKLDALLREIKKMRKALEEPLRLRHHPITKRKPANE